MKSLIFVLVFFMSSRVFAQRQGPSDEQIKAMAKHNTSRALLDRSSGALFRNSNVRAFYEYEKTGYIVMSDDDFSGIAKDMKKIIAQNLPSDVTLLIYTQSTNKNYQQQLFNTYSAYIPKERLRVLQVPRSGSNDFWSRDNTPVPVWDGNKMALVDAQYYYNFEPDNFFGQLFGAGIEKHNYFYEGGNFTTNSLGDCIVVNRKASYPGGVSDTAAIPDDVFRIKYGCKTLIRLKHLKGIGHSDEVVKFMTDKIVLTDTQEYVAELKTAGFTVVSLPEPDLEYETYVNSLIVNDVLYVPIFGERNDQTALNIYKNLNLGYKVVPINSRRLSTQGWGSIHCITMNYPPVGINAITRLLNAENIVGAL